MPTSLRHRLLPAATLLAVLALPLVGPMPAAGAATAGVAAAITGDPLAGGFWIGMRNGYVEARRSARDEGGAPAFAGTATDIVAHPRGGGFWRVKGNGRVHAFGTAQGEPKARPNRDGRVIGIAATPYGTGLWRVTTAGQVMASGTATHHGGARRSDVKIADIAAHPEASGYWIVNRKGRVYARGAARRLNAEIGQRVAGIAAHPGGRGYWIALRSGEVRAYGTAAHHGNASIDSPIVDIAAAADGAGYWLLAEDGRLRRFGSARTGTISTAAPPTPALETVKGIVVARSIARPVRRLLRDAAAKGLHYGGWGYRSYSRQVQLRQQHCGVRYYDVYVKSSSECSPMTAVPGRSMHERGLAIDFYVKRPDGSRGQIAGKYFRWLKRNAATYGLYNLPSEPWHWSTTGG